MPQYPIQIIGHTSSSSTSVSLLSHLPGDLIIISARSATGSAPTMPANAGSVPLWENVRATTSADVSLRTAVALATGSSHTSGTWTGATHLIATVIRNACGATFEVPVSTGATDTGDTLTYPALTVNGDFPLRLGYRCAALKPDGGNSPDISGRIGPLPRVHPSWGYSGAGLSDPTSDSPHPLEVCEVGNSLIVWIDDIAVYPDDIAEAEVSMGAFLADGSWATHTVQIAARNPDLDDIITLVLPCVGNDALKEAVVRRLWQHGDNAELDVVSFHRAYHIAIALDAGSLHGHPYSARWSPSTQFSGMSVLYGGGLEGTARNFVAISSPTDVAPKVFVPASCFPNFANVKKPGHPPSGYAGFLARLTEVLT